MINESEIEILPHAGGTRGLALATATPYREETFSESALQPLLLRRW